MDSNSTALQVKVCRAWAWITLTKTTSLNSCHVEDVMFDDEEEKSQLADGSNIFIENLDNRTIATKP